MKPWWERWPDVYERERAQLSASNISYEETKKDAISGVLELEIDYPEAGRCRVVFPPFYPYTRFELFAPELSLLRHQNPFQKNLCLIGRGSQEWDMDDSVASLLDSQFPKIMTLNEESLSDEVLALEVPQAEPFSAFVPSETGSIVLFDGAWETDPSVDKGELTLSVGASKGRAVKASVSVVSDTDGKVLNTGSSWPAESKTAAGRWWRVATPLPAVSAPKLLRHLKIPVKPQSGEELLTGINSDIVGLLFEEEVQHQLWRDGWLFVLRIRHKPEKGFSKPVDRVFFQRSARANIIDEGFRVPELSHLRSKTVALVGLGCVGAPVALELAKAGIREIRISDPDTVEPGSTVRWPFGQDVFGETKVGVIAAFIRRNYPGTKVVPLSKCIGPVIDANGASLSESRTFFAEVDLVIDTTAEVGIHPLIADLARAEAAWYIMAAATNGGWGGKIVRLNLSDDTTACWGCYSRHAVDGTVENPPEMISEFEQPPGCAEATFFGASFDISQVSLETARLAASTLSVSGDDYPAFDHNVATLRLRDDEGLPTLPTWSGHQLTIHPECPDH